MKMEALVGKIFSVIGVLAFLQTYLPPQLSQIVSQWVLRVCDYVNLHCRINIPEFQAEQGLNQNELYADAEIYVRNLDSARQARNLMVYRERNASEMAISPDIEEVINDTFQGVRMCWSQHTSHHTEQKERHAYTLKVNKVDPNLIRAYFKHVSDRAMELKLYNRELTLYTNSGRSAVCGQGWRGLPFKHPSTFDTLALDPCLKESILKDLDCFKESKEFCRRIGRAWKRGYFLYGLPGTGKSSFIAAIASYMKYDIYDLELTKVSYNQELRALLAQTNEKSIIVIEDIDCSLDLNNRVLKDEIHKSKESNFNSQVTLSGLLNFTDGLWSCCGEERIIIFTTNQPKHLDPALLRCGRMDVHIELSYCNFVVFKILVFNYLRIQTHHLYPLVEDKISQGAQMTLSEIIEILMTKLDDSNEAINGVINALDVKIKQNEV